MILTTSDGSTYQLLNAATKTNLDVDNSGTTVGTKVGLWQSPSGTSPSANQTWTLRNVTPTSQKTVNVQTAVNEKAIRRPKSRLLHLGRRQGHGCQLGYFQGRCGQGRHLRSHRYRHRCVRQRVQCRRYGLRWRAHRFRSGIGYSAGRHQCEAKAGLEAAPAYLHVKASPAFEGDGQGYGTSMGLIPTHRRAGWRQHCRDRHWYQLDDATTIALKGTIYVTAATPENGRHCFQPDRDQPADGIRQGRSVEEAHWMTTRQLKPG